MRCQLPSHMSHLVLQSTSCAAGTSAQTKPYQARNARCHIGSQAPTLAPELTTPRHVAVVCFKCNILLLRLLNSVLYKHPRASQSDLSSSQVGEQPATHPCCPKPCSSCHLVPSCVPLLRQPHHPDWSGVLQTWHGGRPATRSACLHCALLQKHAVLQLRWCRTLKNRVLLYPLPPAAEPWQQFLGCESERRRRPGEPVPCVPPAPQHICMHPETSWLPDLLCFLTAAPSPSSPTRQLLLLPQRFQMPSLSEPWLPASCYFFPLQVPAWKSAPGPHARLRRQKAQGQHPKRFQAAEHEQRPGWRRAGPDARQRSLPPPTPTLRT